MFPESARNKSDSDNRESKMQNSSYVGAWPKSENFGVCGSEVKQYRSKKIKSRKNTNEKAKVKQ